MARPIDSDPENDYDDAMDRPMATQFQIILGRTNGLSYKLQEIERELEFIREKQESLMTMMQNMANLLDVINRRLH